MAEHPSRSVRWAQAVVNAVDAVTDTFFQTMQTIGAERARDTTERPRLGVFVRVTSRAAKGVKWSLIGVVIIGVLALVGVLAARSLPAPPKSPPVAPLARGAAPPIAAEIRLKCAKGAYRDLPEIQAAACGKASTPARGEVQ